MIDKIEISGNKNYKVTDSFRKYATKRIGKLDRYLPKHSKKDAVVNIVVTEINRPHNNKYTISVAMEITGHPLVPAAHEYKIGIPLYGAVPDRLIKCALGGIFGNVFAGIDILEAKLKGQINRFKLEVSEHTPKKSLKNLFIKRS